MTFHTKIVGVTFEGRQRLISRLNRNNELAPGTPLRLVPETDNVYILVYFLRNVPELLPFYCDNLNSICIINDNLLRGRQYFVVVASVSGGQSDDQNYGVNIEVRY